MDVPGISFCQKRFEAKQLITLSSAFFTKKFFEKSEMHEGYTQVFLNTEIQGEL